ncbi:MAG: sodium/solute symporter [Candidatus Omnitrophica bacterium]|nr:Sodium/glucose cotransporter [bacterium]NUN96872.1 sodium/solute symporter [Candidatus Omnitrophota bacterium]
MDPSAPQAFVGLASIDIGIIMVYMVGIFLLGTFFGKFVGTGEDFFLAGRALPFWAIGMSIVVSDIGAFDFVAVAGAVYGSGISAANFDWLGSMPAMAIAAFLFIPYYWRARVYTIPEFLGRRYNNAVRMIHASFWGIFFLVSQAVMLWLTADKFLHGVLGWDPHVSIWVIVIVTGIYTYAGGLTAVVFTDVVQLLIMYVGGLSLLALSFWEVGGWSSLREQVAALGPQYSDHYTILLPHNTQTDFPWDGIVFGLGIVMATSYMAGNQAVVQRTFGAKSEWDAKGGMLFGGFLKVFIPLMVALPGLAALILVPNLEDQDLAIPMLVKQIMPPGLRGLMFAAFLSSLMGNVGATLNSVTTVWTSDIYERFMDVAFKKKLSQRHTLFVGRGFTVLFMILSAVLAERMASVDEGIYVFIQSCLAVFQGPVFGILLVGLLWRRANQWGGLAGLVLGVMFTIVLKNTEGVFPTANPFLFIAMWSFLLSAVVTIVVSLLTPPDPPEKTEGLIFSQVMKAGKVDRVLVKERA